jgi:hypothetical protein
MLGFATAGAQASECNARQRMGRNSLKVHSRLKLEFANRDGAAAVEEAVEAFPSASDSNL